MNIWLTADTHFGHANIIRYCDRPFASVEEMDAVLVERWNAAVKPGDHVYHLGDVFFGKGWENLDLLHGKKRLVAGNHDDLRHPAILKHFQKIMLWRDFDGYGGLLLSHIPVHPNHIVHGRDTGTLRLNVHGHIHNNVVVLEDGTPDLRYRCISVEHTGYAPIPIEEVHLRPSAPAHEIVNHSGLTPLGPAP